MTVEAHLTELRRRHAELSQRVEREQRSPAVPDHEVARLKREKLRLKEAMTRLDPNGA